MGVEHGRGESAKLVANLFGSLAVLLVAGAVSIGLPALDRALPAARPVPTGQRYLVGGGVGLVPPPGALLDVTKTRPGRDRGTALFLVGTVRLVVVAAPFPGTLPAAAERLRRKITATRGYQVTGPEGTVTTGTGLVGRGGGYTAPGRTGRWSVFLAGSVAIEVTVSGARAEFGRALAGIQASIDTISRAEATP